MAARPEPRTDESPLSLVHGQLQQTTDKGRRTIRRLLRLWKLYAVLDFTFMTADIKLVLSWYIADAVINLASVTATLLLAERFAGIGAWTRDQIAFMLGYATLVSGLLNMFFGYNVLIISRRLGRGQLDHTLLQPQPIWMSLLTEGFMPFSSSSVIVPGVGLLVWAASRMALPVTPGWLALLALNLAGSSAVVLAFAFLWGSLAFWAPRAAEEISSSSVQLLSQLKAFPLDGLGLLLRGGLVTILPVGFVAWYPCRALLGLDRSPWAGWITPLAAIVIAMVTMWIFRKGLRHYGRTGSQRYSGLGHRG
jgi:ABC-2 type transport system permease protein